MLQLPHKVAVASEYASPNTNGVSHDSSLSRTSLTAEPTSRGSGWLLHPHWLHSEPRPSGRGRTTNTKVQKPNAISYRYSCAGLRSLTVAALTGMCRCPSLFHTDSSGKKKAVLGAVTNDGTTTRWRGRCRKSCPRHRRRGGLEAIARRFAQMARTSYRGQPQIETFQHTGANSPTFLAKRFITCHVGRAATF